MAKVVTIYVVQELLILEIWNCMASGISLMTRPLDHCVGMTFLVIGYELNSFTKTKYVGIIFFKEFPPTEANLSIR